MRRNDGRNGAFKSFRGTISRNDPAKNCGNILKLLAFHWNGNAEREGVFKTLPPIVRSTRLLGMERRNDGTLRGQLSAGAMAGTR